MPALDIDFSDAPDEPGVSFPSTWRQSVSVADSDAQTDDVEMVNAKTQHPKMKDEEVQSEVVSDLGAVPLMRSGFHKLKELDAFLEQW